MVTDKIKEAFVLIAEDLAIGEITTNYSGRFMHGKKTVGVLLNPDLAFEFLLHFGYKLSEYQDLGKIEEMSVNSFHFCQDNMGLSVILYLT